MRFLTFFKSRTTDLPTFMHLLLFSSIHKEELSCVSEKASFWLYALETIYFKHLRNPPLLIIPSFLNFFFLPLMYSTSERQEHSASCLLLYIKTDWFLFYLRSLQCRLVNDRLPQGLPSAFFLFSFYFPLCNTLTLNKVPTNNNPDHIS